MGGSTVSYLIFNSSVLSFNEQMGEMNAGGHSLSVTASTVPNSFGLCGRVSSFLIASQLTTHKMCGLLVFPRMWLGNPERLCLC